MKRVFIVNGWEGYQEEGWFPWLKKELEDTGFKVSVPQLPEPDLPQIDIWVSKLSESVGTPDSETYFVGHSIGCQTIIRYLESLTVDVQVGGAVFVAGFLKRLTNLEDDEDVRKTAKQWLETPVDLSKVYSRMGKSVAIFSDDDPYVPLDNQYDFKNKLGSEIIVEKGMGHFSGTTGTFKLPIVLEKFLEISK